MGEIQRRREFWMKERIGKSMTAEPFEFPIQDSIRSKNVLDDMATSYLASS
jgi:hypothetical protein